VLSGVAAEPAAAPEPAQVEAAVDLTLPDVIQRRSSPVVQSVAESAGSGLAMPLAGVALAGTLLLAVRRIRARGLRTR
jgi:hypothetical protein